MGSTSAPTRRLGAISRAMPPTGMTAYLPTRHRSRGRLGRRAARDAGARRRARVIGAHLEGPFLAASRPACTRRAPRPADPACCGRCWTRALRRDARARAARRVRADRPLLERGVVVSAGHTDASAAEAHLALRPRRAHRDAPVQRDAPARPARSRDRARRARAARRHDPADRRPAPRRRRHAARRLAGGARPHRARHGRGRRRRRWATATSRSPGGRSWPSEGVVRGPEGQLAGSVADHDRRRAQRARAGDPAGGGAAPPPPPCRRGSRRSDLGRLAPGAPADVVVLDDRLEIVRVLLKGGERVARQVPRSRSSPRRWRACWPTRRRARGRRRGDPRRRPRFAVIAARGSSDNAARYAQHVLGRLCGLPVALAVALAPHRLRRAAALRGRPGDRHLPVRRIARRRRACWRPGRAQG